MNEQLTPQLQLMRRRVQALYQQGGSLSERNEVLAAAFEELEWALEQLQLSEAQQRLQHEEWLSERAELESEVLRYEHLFANAPAGYLVTSLDGTIRKANPAAARMLDCSERQLVGRSIAMFVPEGQRREFRAQISRAAQADGAQEWELAMQSWERACFDAGVTVSAVRGQNGERTVALHWLMREIARPDGAAGPDVRDRAGGAQRAALSQHELDQNALARQRFMFLAKASVQLMVAQDAEAMLGQVASLAVPDLADACVIDLAEAPGQQAQRLVVAREPQPGDQVRMWRRSLAAADGHDARQDLRAALRALGPVSAVVAPLQAGERVIGSLTLTQARRQYDHIDVALFEELARQIAFAVTRAR